MDINKILTGIFVIGFSQLFVSGIIMAVRSGEPGKWGRRLVIIGGALASLGLWGYNPLRFPILFPLIIAVIFLVLNRLQQHS